MSPGLTYSCEKVFLRSVAGCLLLLGFCLLCSLNFQQPNVPVHITPGNKNKPIEHIFIYLIRNLYAIKNHPTDVVNNLVTTKPSPYQVDKFFPPNKTIWNAPGKFFHQRSRKKKNKLDFEALNLRRVCYYTLPTSNGADQLQPEDLDPFLCTHIILFVGNAIVNDTIQLLNATVTTKNIAQTLALKTVNTELKILMSLTQGFSELVANSTAVRSFAYNARLFVERHGLDGLDLDWEFPAWSPDPLNGEKGRFVNLVDKLSTALRLVQPSYLLTAAVTGIQPILDNSYDIPGLACNVDFLSLMAYDYHLYQSYLPFTGHNAPLKPHTTARGYLATLNVEWSVQALLQRGLPRTQLVVGVPIYGRTWRLVSSRWQGLAAPASGPGFGDGYVTYPGAEAMRLSADVAVLDPEARVPYAARGTDWVSYESVESAMEKASWISASGLAGVMTFNLNCDDWAPAEGREKFPLHNAIRRVLYNHTMGDDDSLSHPVHAESQAPRQSAANVD